MCAIASNNEELSGEMKEPFLEFGSYDYWRLFAHYANRDVRAPLRDLCLEVPLAGTGSRCVVGTSGQVSFRFSVRARLTDFVGRYRRLWFSLPKVTSVPIVLI